MFKVYDQVSKNLNAEMERLNSTKEQEVRVAQETPTQNVSGLGGKFVGLEANLNKATASKDNGN